ncbi:MAG: hypothetical protein SynsKO_45210 [Synoicihabitans sp.]
MLPTQQGSVRLFRLWGINVWLHWSWGLIALWAISGRQGYYSSPVWNLIEYVALFTIVLMHEFGHSLASRQVGGYSDQIVLWPLGGVAYVNAPQRPGAQLWSIAAGPLVNVILVPVLWGIAVVLSNTGVGAESRDFVRCFRTIQWINFALLIFNILPIYPLDGGQILRTLLWFKLGAQRSLFYASAIGVAGAAGLVLLALTSGSIWTGVLALFIGSQSWRAFQYARQTRL